MIGFLIGAIAVYLVMRSGALAPSVSTTLVSSQSPEVQAAVAAVESGAAPPAPTAAKVAEELQQFGISIDPNVVPEDDLPGAGSVTLGGSPATTGYNPPASAVGETAEAVSLAKMATGMTASIGGILSGGSAAFAATTLGSVIPFVGIAFSVVGTVIGCIEQHHQQAMQQEARVLDTTLPMILEALVLVCQAAILGEITSVAEAKTYTQEIVNDYYLQVKGIQRGTWNYLLSQSEDPALLVCAGLEPASAVPNMNQSGEFFGEMEGNWFGSSTPGDTMPNPCNAACVYGHYHIERDEAIVLLVVQAILDGKHGIMTFPEIPQNSINPGITGVPRIQMLY
jgi:hypothetical protein